MTKDALLSTLGIKDRLDLIAKMAEILEGIEANEAVRIFFSTLMLLGMEPSKIAEEVKQMKTTKLH